MMLLVFHEVGDHVGQRVCEIVLRALDYAESEHTQDANCCAGDCDSCSARPALEKLEELIGGPEGSLAFPAKTT
jgi:hypothetical protein